MELVERHNDTRPPNALHVAPRKLKDEDDVFEDAWNEKIKELTSANGEALGNRGVRRVSILTC